MRKETDVKTGDEIDRETHFMKGYTVFNVEQIEGLPEHYYAKPAPRFNPVQRIDHTESFFGNLRADIRHGGTRAYYAQAPDYIQMPPFEAFCDAESYYATLAMNPRTGPSTLPAWPVNSGARNGEFNPLSSTTRGLLDEYQTCGPLMKSQLL